jgi:hypothetical protein
MGWREGGRRTTCLISEKAEKQKCRDRQFITRVDISVYPG